MDFAAAENRGVLTPAPFTTTLRLEERNRRVVPHRLERCGYAPVCNQDATDGLWKIDGKRSVIYARHDLPAAERSKAIATFIAVKRKLFNDVTTF